MEANCPANWQTPTNHRGPTAPAEGDLASEFQLSFTVPLATLTPRCGRPKRMEPSGVGNCAGEMRQGQNSETNLCICNQSLTRTGPPSAGYGPYGCRVGHNRSNLPRVEKAQDQGQQASREWMQDEPLGARPGWDRSCHTTIWTCTRLSQQACSTLSATALLPGARGPVSGSSL